MSFGSVAAPTTVHELERALERDELRLFFQPIVSLQEARCVGAEALVRWQHPQRGLLVPDEFVPLAEASGLLREIDGWVLATAAREAARWQIEHAAAFVVSVNVSAGQLALPDFVERLAAAIETTGVAPENLGLEITERTLMENADQVTSAGERARALGVRMSIDDFGTGQSSSASLERFPSHVVKIDRAFLTGLGTDPGASPFVAAVIDLAHALGRCVVAEGVETEPQVAELVELGCDAAQGYHFAPPQPVGDLRALLGRKRNWRPPSARLMTGLVSPGRKRSRA